MSHSLRKMTGLKAQKKKKTQSVLEYIHYNEVNNSLNEEKIPYMKSNHQLKDKKNISLNKKIIRKQQVQK